MDLILALLLIYTTEVKPAPVADAFRRGRAQARGVKILRGKRVLMFGDSMVNCGINVWLEPWFRKQGVATYITRSWASSTTVSWSTRPKLLTYMWKYDPDIIIVVLGSNELFHPYPRMKIRPIQTILKKLGRRRVVYWVGPPAWKPDKGIIAVMKAQMPRGHFFDSSKVAMGRQKDGYHPNMAGSKAWAMALRRWFVGRMNALSAPRPAQSSGRSARVAGDGPRRQRRGLTRRPRGPRRATPRSLR